MGNTNVNSTIILRKFMDSFHNKIKFAKSVDRQYDERFKSNPVSGKPGTSLKIRKPAQFTVREGRVANVQDVYQDTLEITCTQQIGIDFAFTSEERAMNIDDMDKLVLTPAAERLATDVDRRGLAQYKWVPNLVGDFTVDDDDDLLACHEKLNNMCCPEDGRILMISPKANRTLVNGLAGAYNNQQIIGQQNKTGNMAYNYGFDFQMSQNVQTHTTGSRVATADQYGVASLSGDTLTLDSAYAVTWKQGDVITIDGINEVNPETKEDLGYLKQFVVKEDASSSSTLKISPTPVLYSSSPARANCTGAADASGHVNVVGVSSTSYRENLAYHPSAFTLVTADLDIPRGVDEARRETMDNISMRYVRFWDGINDLWIGRFDIYCGWTTIYPERAVRLPGSVG